MSRIWELAVQAAPGDLIAYDPVRLAGALGIDDPSRLSVETDGMHRALVTIYPSDPLAKVVPPDPAALAMDERGYIWTGRYHNGRAFRMRLYDPSSGSAQRSLVFGTTGAGKSTANHILIAAEKRSGVCTWVADLKGGGSVPEARGNVDWFVTTQEGAMAQLCCYWLVMQGRQIRYAEAGRSKFLKDRPDPLMSLRIDEANRLLEKGAPYRDLATFLIKDIGRTGRSLGMGIHLAAQAGHLEELGGSDTLRSMLKEGEVVLLRWTSGMMRQLVTDGLLPPGQVLAPIPKYAGATRLVSQFDPDVDDSDRPGTQGTCYLITGAYPTARARFWGIGSTEPTEGLDPEILKLYGDGEPNRLEAASWDTAGQAYAGRLDGEDAFAIAFADAFPEAAAEQEEKQQSGTGGRGRARSAGPAFPAAAVPAQAQPRSLTLAERVQAVLDTADGPMDAREVWEAVNRDGGREVRLGSVRNALTALRN